MKIAINISPLRSKHKDRGIGFYTSNLVENLKKDPQLTIQEFTQLKEVKDADIVHYPWFDFFFHTLNLRRKFKTIVTVHDVIPLVFPKQHAVGLKGNFNFFLQKLALKDCNNIITDSKVSKTDISKYLKINEDKISVVHLAANENFQIQNEAKRLYTKRKYKLPEKVILYVGDANWVKNLPFLIKGFSNLIQDSYFQDVKLVLVGGVFLKHVENIDHPELQSLKEVNRLIKELSLDSNILTPGDLDLDDLVSFYNAATVYIQPSLYEGFGLPLIEAFSCGVPVISSGRGSLMEIGGEAVIYFDPTNLNQLVTILKEVLSNKSLRDRLSKLSLSQAKKYSWQKVASDTKEVYLKTFRND